MRIISGDKKGLKLKTLEGDSTRPTLDRVKESLFNIVYSKKSFWPIVLDLFAGSGGLGLETLSRGSNLVVFCDNSKEAINIINDNINKCGYIDKSKMLNDDYISCLQQFKNSDMSFDLIFLDPPYNKAMGIEAIKYISQNNLLNEDGLIVYEASILEKLPNEIEKCKMIDKRKYGKVQICIYVKGVS